MRAPLWFAAGAGAAIYVIVRGRRAAEALTIDGLQDRLNGLAVGARMFRDEVAQGKAEAEIELRERFSLAAHGIKELEQRPEEEGRS
ncbi:MAG TPA: DUF6167 family protein [Nocardioides sp.]|uniref:DUF6167 family protein n=1 Tax=uncultured Nocardioides sp. TaxID=198441 RepID=UPI0026125971|nr:DUF6167 family protein [uncultured Nocardioides sp.]HRD61782.1 DUF6167 family protein [Nocardioides sp.]HRI96569.1 DUF6167 family protein [Nocardioides sp.]